MKITAKYSVLFYDGRKVTKKVKYDCPDFEDNHYEFHGHKSVETAVQQADKWLEEIDKAVWMDENDVYTIFDWKIVSAVKDKVELVPKEVPVDKRKVVGIWLRELSGMSEGFQNEFEAVYSEMYPKIKRLSAAQQISVTLRATGVAVQAAGTAYKNITDYMDSLKDKSLEELKQLTAAKEKQKEIC